MQSLVEILLIVFPVFLVIGLGFSLRRTGLVDSDFLFKMNRLIYYVALPALLFYKISRADFSASFNPRLLFGMIVSYILVFAISYGYAAMRRYPAEAKGAFSQGAFRGNLAYIGLPIIFNAFGEKGFAIAGIMIGFLVPLMNFLAVIALLLPQEQREHSLSRSFWMYQYIFNPLIIASFLGIFWSFFDLPLPQVFNRAFDILTGMALPLALISIGASFSPKKLQDEIFKAVMATGIKTVWMPLLTTVILMAFGISGVELAVGVLLAATPTATSAYIMAQQLKSDAEMSGAIIMLSTMFSVITFSAWLYVLEVANL